MNPDSKLRPLLELLIAIIVALLVFVAFSFSGFYREFNEKDYQPSTYPGR